MAQVLFVRGLVELHGLQRSKELYGKQGCIVQVHEEIPEAGFDFKASRKQKQSRLPNYAD